MIGTESEEIEPTQPYPPNEPSYNEAPKARQKSERNALLRQMNDQQRQRDILSQQNRKSKEQNRIYLFDNEQKNHTKLILPSPYSPRRKRLLKQNNQFDSNNDPSSNTQLNNEERHFTNYETRNTVNKNSN